MFIGDDVRAEASPAAAAARLATLARGSSLTRASHAAWDTATASASHSRPSPGLPRLTRVHSHGPVQRGATAVLMLRWEAVAQGGRPFPALDADITLVPDGEHAVLVRLTGVCRQPPGTRPGQPAAQAIAADAIRSLLTRIADAVGDPAAPAAEGSSTGEGSATAESRATAENRATAIPPGKLAWASPATT